MRTDNLVIRCYAKQDGDAWVAVAIDLSLAAQAESLDDAKLKLEQMISSYVQDAFATDKAFGSQLLQRKAPLSQRLEYFRLLTLSKFFSLFSKNTKAPRESETTFDELLPVTPLPNL